MCRALSSAYQPSEALNLYALVQIFGTSDRKREFCASSIGAYFASITASLLPSTAPALSNGMTYQHFAAASFYVLMFQGTQGKAAQVSHHHDSLAHGHGVKILCPFRKACICSTMWHCVHIAESEGNPHYPHLLHHSWEAPGWLVVLPWLLEVVQ